MSHQLILQPGQITAAEIRRILSVPVIAKFSTPIKSLLDPALKTVQQAVAAGKAVYGVNTGFGMLANTHIPRNQLISLQRSLIYSHAAGVGEPLETNVVRLILLLKACSLAQGYSGVGHDLVERLIEIHNAGIIPVIPAQGSVGASGDLAPLAHLSCTLLGIGEVTHKGRCLPAATALAQHGLKPIELRAKEGLALLNGSQVSTALAWSGLLQAENLFAAASITGAMSVEAALASRVPFDARIHAVRKHQAQIDAAFIFRHILGSSSAINRSHDDCDKVQDPYSLRCQPQVMGACLNQIRRCAEDLLIEANAVTDNPLIFPEEQAILSGGNFHAEIVAMAADNLALALAEIGALSERRIALLMDSNLSTLPAFLVEQSGVNSGFMMAQVTAAALASENKSLAHPAVVDSLPTSANQEDHVSMSTFAARRLTSIARNTRHILAIELLAASQGLDFRHPLTTSPILEKAKALLRQKVPFYSRDRLFAPDINQAATLIADGAFNEFIPAHMLPSLGANST